MLRMRRYRVFVVFAVVAVFALYKFGSSGTSWVEDGPKIEHSDETDNKHHPLTWVPRPQIAEETKKFEVEIPAAQTSKSLLTPPPVASVSKPVQKLPPEPATPAAFTPTTRPTPIGVGGPENEPIVLGPGEGEILAEHGEGRLEVPALPSTAEAIHWRPQSQHFPIPSESTIQLPSGSPKPIPKIQFAFKEETPQAKTDREAKLSTVKEVFKRSWKGYREKAWMRDELSPVSGGNRDPFAGWGATLVDALDTLWIMGLKTEFEEAVAAVDKIDFTTSPRGDIPLFETTIRYLGGLVAAYDISGMKHETLLKKAVELAEVLISAFDTPNRMPQTYYYWRPTFASQPHRASNRVVLAEIGSLSVEFTRLAQLTGEPKYYDAVARITNALEEFQNSTRLPGMWPTWLDASGCKKPDYTATLQTPLEREGEKVLPLEQSTGEGTQEQEMLPLDLPKPITFVAGEADKSTEEQEMRPLDLPEPITFVAGEAGKSQIKDWDSATDIGGLTKTLGSLNKRQLEESHEESEKELQATAPEVIVPSTSALQSLATPSAPVRPECEEQGFVSTSNYGTEEYTLGGMSDSTYEYLPKQWLLLGGLVGSYRDMYEMSMDVVKKYLIFRPMLPNEDEILFSGKLNVYSAPRDDGEIGNLEPENAHLTCFAGGMFAMGAKIFDRKEDLEIAQKLTEGCVWSYNATSTGIMPESFLAVPCDSTEHCEWNQTKYWEAIDPASESRLETYEAQMVDYRVNMASASAEYAALMASATAPAAETALEAPEGPVAAVIPTAHPADLQKRQLELSESTEPPSKVVDNKEGEPERAEAEGPTPVEATPSSTLPVFPFVYSPKPPLTHEEYVKNRIQEARLPKGVTSIGSSKYILRPEAIESVWYMYRITGDSHWREVGWNMFNAVNTHTAALYGNSAIDDVTKTAPTLLDEMESFWLAETLKYFYLLFAEEDVVSLDDWVLNTEAHPFKRPK